MFALDDLTKLFELTVREDSLAGGLTVTARTQSIVLTPGQSLASVGGRLISLPAPPARDGRSWFVPVDFVPRALGARARHAGRASQAVAADPRRRRPRAPHRRERRSPRRARAADARRRAADAAHGHAGRQPAGRSSSKPTRSMPTLPAVSAPDLIQNMRPATARASSSTSARDSGRSGRRISPATAAAGRIIVDVITQTTAAAAGDGRRRPRHRSPPAAPTSPPPLLDLAPSGGIRTIVVDAGHGGTEDGAHGPGGTLEKNVTLSVARRLEGGARSPPGRARDPDARRRRHRRTRRARGARQQQQGGPLRQPPRQRLGSGVGRRGRGLLPEPRRVRGPGAARRQGRDRGAAGVWRRHARHRGHPLGDGAGALHRRVGGAREGSRGRPARARADEPARDSAGPLPRARGREHAGRARRDGLHHQRGAGTAAVVRAVPGLDRPGDRRQHHPLPGQTGQPATGGRRGRTCAPGGGVRP